MKTMCIIAIIFLFQSPVFSQPKIIFDTDFGADADDLGALVMLHNYMEKGECELLAVMSWSVEKYTIAAIDAVNRYYDHPDILLGTRKGKTFYQDWNYNKSIVDKLDHKKDYVDALDATILYRRLLEKSPDKSITIVTVGPLMNIQNLLQSEADTISTLTGKELVEKKVKECVIMGGQFPEGKNEWNFDGEMSGVTQFVIENLNVPIVFSGYELGHAIKTGKAFNSIDNNHPLFLGFLHFSQNAPWIKEQFNGDILDNASYDQTAVLFAVKNGVGRYWEKINDGYCRPDSSGGNQWIPVNKPTNHSYLKRIMPAAEIADIIESVMLNDF